MGISNLKKKEKENHDRMLRIRISLGSKLYLQNTILIFFKQIS